MHTRVSFPRLFLVSFALAACAPPRLDDEVGDDESCGETAPPVLTSDFCEDPVPDPPTPSPIPNVQLAATEQVVLDLAEDPCPQTEARFNSIPNTLRAIMFVPSDNSEGPYDLMVFSHGNLQEGNRYSETLTPLAESGVVVASIAFDGNVGDDGSISRRTRLLCVAEALLYDRVQWDGRVNLTNRFVIGGHSTGGRGAFGAAQALTEDPAYMPEFNLTAVAAIAPNDVEAEEPPDVLEGGPAYIVLQGTRDGDTSGAAPSHYDSVVATGGPAVTFAPRKAMIWAYGFEHNEFGGHGDDPMNTECPTTERGRALFRYYINGFVLGILNEDSDRLARFFSPFSPQIEDEVVQDYWADFGDEPQIYGTSSERVDGNLGYESFVIDGFENGDLATADSGSATFRLPFLWCSVSLPSTIRIRWR